MEEKLTKAAISESLHNKLSLSRADIHRVIDELFEEIKDGLKEDRVIELRGFGTFEVRTRKGREKARNPKTGGIAGIVWIFAFYFVMNFCKFGVGNLLCDRTR